MKQLNRFVAVLLLLGMLLALAGCSPYDNPERYVEIEKYRDWEVERSYIAVDDELVRGEILNDFYEFIEFNEINEGEVKNGDPISVDYILYLEDVPVIDPVENYEFYVGSGEFMTEVEEALVGTKVGETVKIPVTFPDDYTDALLAGKDGVFEFTVNHIIDVVIPELTDEFVSANSDYATYDELFAAKKEYLEKENLADVLWKQIVSFSTIKSYPKAMKDQYVEDNVKLYKAYAAELGRDYEEFIQDTFSCNEKEFEDFLREKSVDSIENELIVRAIAKRENITVSEEEYQAEIEDNYAVYGFSSPEEFETYYGGNYIYVHLMQEKVLDFVASTVTFF